MVAELPVANGLYCTVQYAPRGFRDLLGARSSRTSTTTQRLTQRHWLVYNGSKDNDISCVSHEPLLLPVRGSFVDSRLSSRHHSLPGRISLLSVTNAVCVVGGVEGVEGQRLTRWLVFVPFTVVSLQASEQYPLAQSIWKGMYLFPFPRVQRLTNQCHPDCRGEYC